MLAVSRAEMLLAVVGSGGLALVLHPGPELTERRGVEKENEWAQIEKENEWAQNESRN